MLAGGGCGFRPLYGTDRRGRAKNDLGAIAVAPIKDRVGQVLRNHLIDRLGRASGQAPRYTLTVAVERLTQGKLVQLDDATTRFDLTLTARFSLTEQASGSVLYTDSARAVGSYNVVNSEFATLIAEEDAANEAARVLGDEIRFLLAAFLSRPRRNPEPAT